MAMLLCESIGTIICAPCMLCEACCTDCCRAFSACMRHVSCAMVLTVILDIVPGVLGIIFGAIDFDSDCSMFASIFLLINSVCHFINFSMFIYINYALKKRIKENSLSYSEFSEFFCRDPGMAIYFCFDFLWIIWTIVGNVQAGDLSCMADGFSTVYLINCNVTWVMFIFAILGTCCSVLSSLCCCCSPFDTMYGFFISDSYIREARAEANVNIEPVVIKTQPVNNQQQPPQPVYVNNNINQQQQQQQVQFQPPPNDQPIQYGPPVVVAQPVQYQQPQQVYPQQPQYQYQVPPPPPQPSQQQQQQQYPPGPSSVQPEESKAEKAGRMIGKGINSAITGVVNTGKKIFK